MMTNLNRANSNSIWASVLIEALVRRRITHFIISPGSRSTPLAIAAAEHEWTTTTVHFDERGAGYFAVGYARGTGRSAALICTSGTAAANYLPAVIEASQDNLPLVILTADRPPEKWDVGTNQTIRQSGIYSHYTRYNLTLPVPDPNVPLTFMIESINHACDQMQKPDNPGPVHLNCPFEKPLEPMPVARDFTRWLSPLDHWINDTNSRLQNSMADIPEVDSHIPGKIAARLARSTHGLLVFGRENDRVHADAYLRLAKTLKWPIVVDIQSPLRSAFKDSELLTLNEDILSHTILREQWQPNVILHFGGSITSQVILNYFASVQPESYIQIHPYSRSLDPSKTVTQHLQTEGWKVARTLVDRLAEAEIAASYFDPDWVKKIKSWEHRYFENLVNELYEAHLARFISQNIPVDTTVFLGNSMPIRDFDRFGKLTSGCQVYANRGASGIDGNIATLAGLAEGKRRPVVGVIGDLAALHDLNSLHLLKQSHFPIVLIIINNHGGGIFSHLPVSQFPTVFETYFEASHTYDFKGAAQQFGVEHQIISGTKDLSKLPEYLSSTSSLIVEIQTERSIQADFRSQLRLRMHEELNGNFE